MGGFLVIADHLRGVVRDVTAELVTAASELGGPVVVVVLGSDPGGLAPACSLDGVDEIVEIAVPSDGIQNFLE